MLHGEVLQESSHQQQGTSDKKAHTQRRRELGASRQPRNPILVANLSGSRRRRRLKQSLHFPP